MIRVTKWDTRSLDYSSYISLTRPYSRIRDDLQEFQESQSVST